MPENEGLKDIPQEDLGKTVQEFADLAGATHIVCVKQPNGKWSVVDRRQAEGR